MSNIFDIYSVYFKQQGHWPQSLNKQCLVPQAGTRMFYSGFQTHRIIKILDCEVMSHTLIVIMLRGKWTEHLRLNSSRKFQSFCQNLRCWDVLTIEVILSQAFPWEKFVHVLRPETDIFCIVQKLFNYYRFKQRRWTMGTPHGKQFLKKLRAEKDFKKK